MYVVTMWNPSSNGSGITGVPNFFIMCWRILRIIGCFLWANIFKLGNNNPKKYTLTCVRKRSGVGWGGSKQWRHSHFGKDGVHFLSIPHVKERSELHELPLTQNSFPKVEHLTVKVVCQLKLPSQPTVSTSLLPLIGSVQLTTKIRCL